MLRGRPAGGRGKWARRTQSGRMGLIGGGPGAFIGEVHRKASRLDGEIELVAGAANILLMSLNIRDGLRLSGRLK